MTSTNGGGDPPDLDPPAARGAADDDLGALSLDDLVRRMGELKTELLSNGWTEVGPLYRCETCGYKSTEGGHVLGSVKGCKRSATGLTSEENAGMLFADMERQVNQTEELVNILRTRRAIEESLRQLQVDLDGVTSTRDAFRDLAVESRAALDFYRVAATNVGEQFDLLWARSAVHPAAVVQSAAEVHRAAAGRREAVLPAAAALPAAEAVHQAAAAPAEAQVVAQEEAAVLQEAQVRLEAFRRFAPSRSQGSLIWTRRCSSWPTLSMA